MANRNRVPPLEENPPRSAPRPARPVRGPRPAGSLGIPPGPQHDRHRRCRAGALAGIDPDLITFTAVLGLVRAASTLTPAARTAAVCPRRSPRASLVADVAAHPPPPPGPEAHVRPDSSRTTHQAHRRSRLTPSPSPRQISRKWQTNTRKLRAVGLGRLDYPHPAAAAPLVPRRPTMNCLQTMGESGRLGNPHQCDGGYAIQGIHPRRP